MINKSNISKRKYTNEEKEWVRNYYLNHSRKETAEEFNRLFNANINSDSIKTIIRHSVGVPKKKFRYNQEQKEWIIEYYKNHTLIETTNEFNKLFNSNLTKACINGLLDRENMRVVQKGHLWSKEELDWMKMYYLNHSAKDTMVELKNKFGLELGEDAINSVAKRYGFEHFRKDEYTKEQEQFLIDNYENLCGKDMTREFNEKFGLNKKDRAIRSKMSLLGLNTKCVPIKLGETTTWRDRTMIKVGENEYMPYRNYIWEKYHNKKVPNDCIVTFKDDNCNNFSVDNLACVSKKTMAMLNFNKLRNKGEITNTAIMLGELMYLNDKGRDENVY